MFLESWWRVYLRLFPLPAARAGSGWPVYRAIRNRIGLNPWRLHGDLSDRRRNCAEAAAAYFQEPGRVGLLASVGRSISTGAEMSDYWMLHSYITTRRPRRVLECGSGVTSVIIAHALCEVATRCPASPPGHLWTMESIPEYYEDARALCPEELRAFVTYHLSPQVERCWRGRAWVSCYERLPESEFDFVWVDGPDLKTPYGKAPNGDILFLADRIGGKRFDVLVDKRKMACEIYARFWGPELFGFDYALRIGVGRGLSGTALARFPRLPRKIEDRVAFDHMIGPEAAGGQRAESACEKHP